MPKRVACICSDSARDAGKIEKGLLDWPPAALLDSGRLDCYRVHNRSAGEDCIH